MRILIILILVILVISGLFLSASLAFKNTSYNSNLGDTFRQEFTGSSFSERRSVFEKYYDKLGPSLMLDILEDEYRPCHSQSHQLGQLVFSRVHDFSAAGEICRNRCTNGCFHGVLMEAFKNIAEKKDEEYSHPEGTDSHLHIELTDIAPEIKNFCNRPEDLNISSKGSCIHGFGHVFEFLSEYTLDVALNQCKIFDNKLYELYCASGVFMERNIALYQNNEYFGFSYEDILSNEGVNNNHSSHYPCDVHDGYPAACYIFQAKHIAKNFNSDEIAEECLKLDEFNRHGCLFGLGFTYYHTLVLEPHRLEDICSVGDFNDQKFCIEGAILMLTYVNKPAALKVCDYLTGGQKEICLQAAADQFYNDNRDWNLYLRN